MKLALGSPPHLLVQSNTYFLIKHETEITKVGPVGVVSLQAWDVVGNRVLCALPANHGETGATFDNP